MLWRLALGMTRLGFFIFLLLCEVISINATVPRIAVILDEKADATAPSLASQISQVARSWPTPELDIISVGGGNASSLLHALCRALESRPFFMIGSLTPDSAHLIDTFTRRFNMPYITWDASISLSLDLLSNNQPASDVPASFHGRRNASKACRVFSLRPDLTQPLIDFLVRWRWNRFTYLYASQDAFERMEAVVLELYRNMHTEKMAPKKYPTARAKRWAAALNAGGSGHPMANGKPVGSKQNYAEEGESEEEEEGEESGEVNEGEEADGEETVDDEKLAQVVVDTGFIDINRPDVMYRTLKKVDAQVGKMKTRQIVIDMGGGGIFGRVDICQRLNRLFDWLAKFGMLRAEYHYLLVDFNILDLDLVHYKESRVNISGFYMLDYDMKETRELYSRWATSSIPIHDKAFLLDVFSRVRLIRGTFTHAYEARRSRTQHWPTCYSPDGTGLISNRANPPAWPLGAEVADNLVSQRMTGLTGEIGFDAATCKRRSHSIVHTQFSGKRGANVMAEWSLKHGWIVKASDAAGSWNQFGSRLGPDHHAQFHFSRLDMMRRQNKSIRVVTILSPPFVMYSNQARGEPKSGRKNFQGYCIDLADLIFRNLSLHYELHLVKDNIYGEFLEVNRSWNGLIGELMRGEADVVIAPMTMTSIRAKYVDFTEPFMNFGLSVMLRKPGKTKPGTFSFLSPLKDSLWLSIVTASCMVSMGLRAIAAVSPYEKARTDDTGGFTIVNSLWFSFASFVHQGIDLFPLSPGARILSSVWRFFCLLIMAYYTANLAAALSVEGLIAPINSIKDLVVKKELGIKVGMLNAGATKEFFATSTDKTYQQIYSQLERDRSSYAKTTQEGIERVRSSLYAFIMESKTNEFVNHRRPCNTMLVGDVFGSKAYAVAVPANQPWLEELKDKITDAILLLREDQMLARLYKEWWIEKGECIEGSEGSRSEPLALVNLSGAFYILIIGLVVAMVTGMSLFIHQLRKSNKL